MMREYSDDFFDYIERGSKSSARRFAQILLPILKPQSILDVGCGRGAWLMEWKNAGVETVHGVDGPYVLQNRLLIHLDEFTPQDLSASFDLGKRFDLVTSLEVAEHLPPESSAEFVRSLCKHADMVLFSAATVGQGGEYHVNERPLLFWQTLFADNGYVGFDLVRPQLYSDESVERWYRYNSVLYVSRQAINLLPSAVTSTEVSPGQMKEIGDVWWKLRRALIGLLPVKTVTALAQWNARRKAKGFRSHR